MTWTVEFLNSEVEQEFLCLPKDMQARFIRVSELIENYGLVNIGMPHIRHLQDKLWEIRAKGKCGISRGIYVVCTGKRVVILRIFVKKTQQTPKAELELALRRMEVL